MGKNTRNGSKASQAFFLINSPKKYFYRNSKCKSKPNWKITLHKQFAIDTEIKTYQIIKHKQITEPKYL